MSLKSPSNEELTQKESLIFAGLPVTASISFQSSFHWSSNDDDAKQYQMSYEIDESVKDWLVGGQKRGEFITTVSHANTMQIDPYLKVLAGQCYMDRHRDPRSVAPWRTSPS